MRSASQHIFATVPKANIPRSSFKRDMTWKTAFNSGYLVPIFVDEALPGDTFNLKLTSFMRLSTPICPFMDNLYCDFHFFAVPIRLIWENFERMLGAQDNPGDSIDYLTPIVNYTSPVEVGSFGDYIGLPVQGVCKPVAFWHRAHNLIYNEWFRDENLQDSVEVPTGDGPDDPSIYQLYRRGKRHDYLTSCLPFAQKFEGASIGLAGSAKVFGDGNALPLTSAVSAHLNGNYVGAFSASGTSTQPGLNKIYASTQNDYSPVAVGSGVPGGTVTSTAVNRPFGVPTKEQAGGQSVGLVADLTEASAVTINSLREAFAVQRWCERCARGGTRFTELLRAHFGVVSPDARLQRPEYLGGGSTPIQIHSVAQTSSSDTTSPQGNLAAYGVGGARVGFTKSFVEHSVIIGYASVRADLTYQQGLHRMFSRRNKFDFYWPVFCNLGEQAVLNKEIYFNGDADDDKVFGYQERWAEYRYGQSRITGKLRSHVDGSLDVWHLAQYFENRPALNSQFIEERPPVERVLAVQDENEPQIIYDSLISLNCVRPMGTYSVPGLVDHF